MLVHVQSAQALKSTHALTLEWAASERVARQSVNSLNPICPSWNPKMSAYLSVKWHLYFHFFVFLLFKNEKERIPPNQNRSVHLRQTSHKYRSSENENEASKLFCRWVVEKTDMRNQHALKRSSVQMLWN